MPISAKNTVWQTISGVLKTLGQNLGILAKPKGTATSQATQQPSEFIELQASGWDGAAELLTSMILKFLVDTNRDINAADNSLNAGFALIAKADANKQELLKIFPATSTPDLGLTGPTAVRIDTDLGMEMQSPINFKVEVGSAFFGLDTSNFSTNARINILNNGGGGAGGARVHAKIINSILELTASNQRLGDLQLTRAFERRETRDGVIDFATASAPYDLANLVDENTVIEMATVENLDAIDVATLINVDLITGVIANVVTGKGVAEDTPATVTKKIFNSVLINETTKTTVRITPNNTPTTGRVKVVVYIRFLDVTGAT